MKQKTVGLWMYRNDGGHVIQDKLKKKLEEKNVKVITDFDMRKCYCLNGRVYTEDGFDLSSVDVFYHMNADEQTVFQNDILHALELSGVKVINNWNAFSTAKHKFMTNVLLKKNGILVPPALFVSSKQAKGLAERIFDDWKKIVVKPLRNHGGIGIIRFDSVGQFKDFVEATENCFESYYIEKFIEFGVHDYRTEILNNEIIGSYCRVKTHAFKTNVTSGGKFISDIPSKEFEEIALKASKVLRIETTVVDMIKSEVDEKIYILEVNPIMGVFLEAFIAFSPKIKNNPVYSSLAFDDKKIDLLIRCLTEKMISSCV